MDIQEYKLKKLDKITREIVTKINNLPSFGYESEIDSLAQQAMTTFLLSIVAISNIREDEIDVISQSVIDDLTEIAQDITDDLLELSRAR